MRSLILRRLLLREVLADDEERVGVLIPPSNGGAIVNVSSGSAYIGNPNDSVQYAVSKGAVNSFTIGVSQEVAGEGIRVNAVSPGLTDTDMPTPEKLAAAVIPIGRVATPAEVAEAIRWLASARASHVAGANIRVAGGRP